MKIKSIITAGFLISSITSATAEDTPYTAENESLYTLSGKVTQIAQESFVLDYGKGDIVIEMDDYGKTPEVDYLSIGDEVTVHGFIDADEGEVRSIEAGSVYVKSLNTYYYANGSDEEDYMSVQTKPRLVAYPKIRVQGVIEGIEDEKFQLSTPIGSMIIDTKEMDNNPTDEDGFHKLQAGD